MSTKAAHTPTPWRLIVERDISRTVISPVNSNEICLFSTGSFSDDVEQANAEFTMTAVNHHQELITRLHNLVNVVDAILPGYHNPSGVMDPIFFCAAEARETLKKVIQ